MTKEKQIEEMTSEFNAWCDGVSMDICATRECTRCCAEVLTEKGYRKASEVAMEIFEEIEESLHNLAQLYLNCDLKDNFGICYSIYEEAVLPIKKKYTEGEETKC